MRVKVYISHPFTGNEEANIKEAQKYKKEWQKANPTDQVVCMLGELTPSGSYMKDLYTCLQELGECDILVLTGNWQKSTGCMAEYGYAVAKGMQIYDLHSFLYFGCK